MLRSERRAVGMLVILAMAVLPLFTAADAQAMGASSRETIAQAATTAPFISRQSGTQAPTLIAPSHLVERLRIPSPQSSNGGRPRCELTFGGVTASFASLCCLFLVYLI